MDHQQPDQRWAAPHDAHGHDVHQDLRGQLSHRKDPRMTTIGQHETPTRAAATPVTDRYVVGVTLLAAAFTLIAGVWALLWPGSFAEAIKFPEHTHFLHDVGAFQIGIGVTLALAVPWRDALAVVLTGFLVGNTIHAANHVVDLDLGGRDSDPWLLGLLSLLVAVALVGRLRQLHYVVGRVEPTCDPRLAPFVDQKTALLITFRRDGTPVATPLSVAVEGGHAYVRTYEQAGKTKRLRNDSHVELAPSTTRGTPTGAPIPAEARRLDVAGDHHAARLLRRKHPLLHGVLVPLLHRLGRAKTGHTVHFELTPSI
jgi:PPOX class probable F420-dependent enzyme